MRRFFTQWVHQWSALLRERSFRFSLILGLVLLLIAFYLNYRAVLYVDEIPVISVGDLILDVIDTYDLSFIFVYGIYTVAAIITFYPLLFKPELVPFTAKTVAAYIMIRAGFISLTHIGAPEDFFRMPQFDDQSGVFKLFYMNDLFFSGHTAFPFLGALLFWENKILRWFLILTSIVQGMTVLLMHVHYSIDVFAAYFIVYSIYVVSDKIFNKLNHSFRKIAHKVLQFYQRETGNRLS